MDRSKVEGFTPPDGGYGWVVVLATTLINVSVLPLVQCFGIIYQRDFKISGVTAAETSFLFHLHSAIYSCLGLFSSPLLKKYDFRRVALFGVSLMCVGIFLSVGQGIMLPASYMATNTYFKKRLTLAVSFSATGASISSILMPQLCNKLLAQLNSTQNTVLVLAAISLLAIVCCFLLKPIQTKTESKDEDTLKSLQEENHETKDVKTQKQEEIELLDSNDKVYKDTTMPVEQKSVFTKIYELFDLELLSDHPYVIAIIGMSISFASELNTILMLAFILPELASFKREDVALAISVQSIADIIGRLGVPLIGHWFSVSPRIMYANSLIVSTVGRIVMANFYASKPTIYFCVSLLGLAKGIKAVYQSVIIPKYVTLEKLPAANGLNMLLTGTASLVIGPIIGVIHDATNSYIYALHAASLLSIKNKAVKIGAPKSNRRRLRVGDPDFVPPDGGWGWLIVFACGFSNLSTFPMFQQFGLVFRQKFGNLNISNTQTTTVINLNSAFNACVGLLNGPVFRVFTYRQVAMFGSCLVASSLFVSTFCESFWTYLIFYAMCYGSGIGITQSSNALALNTYFKERRRIATGLSWTTTALGPIVWPYIITALLEVYGMEGTLLIFSSFALHAFMCSLLLQPVEWHTKFREVEDGSPESKPFLEKETEAVYAGEKLNKSSKSRSLLSSQYIYNEDDPVATGYEIIDPGTPMMIRANDGWYSQNRSLVGSRISLASNKTNKGTSKMPSGQNSVTMSKRPSYNNLSEARSKRNSSVNLTQDGKERKRERRLSQSKPAIREEVEEHHNGNHLPNDSLTVPVEYPNEKDVLKTAAKKLAEYQQETEHEEEKQEEQEETHQKMNLFQKIYIFFDFDLFKDLTYVNLMLGITIANFVEINFSIITPMVLEEFHFGKYQIATFMSLLGATDIVVRFFIPFIAGKIGWENKTFFLVGVLSMAFGRVILVHTQTYIAGLVVAVIIGAGKGLRTIFMALVIPTHVPLERLPAASGLQLATSGLFFLALGPVVVTMVTTIKVPPDGGYGWIIVLANALSNVIIIPLMQSFGLIFKDTFVEMGLSATEGSLIINLNAAFGMITGLLNGFLLKMFGYRKIAVSASCLVTTGIILTSLALNSYFRKNRGKAVGYAMTLTGLGPILMPQLINLLMKIHTVQGVTLILGGIAANSFVAASLLHPVKWHMKTEIIEDEKLEDIPEEKTEETNTKIKMFRSELSRPIKKKPQWKRFLDSLVKFFDLDLLMDPIYVNIMVGLSLAIFAEINFSLLTAFILAEFGLNTYQIATFMSILGIADIVFRFLAPYIANFLKLPPRPIFIGSIVGFGYRQRSQDCLYVVSDSNLRPNRKICVSIRAADDGKWILHPSRRPNYWENPRHNWKLHFMYRCFKFHNFHDHFHMVNRSRNCEVKKERPISIRTL
ncbi:uncharacterized protein BDFB_002007, partial [Asbolus verrucosus]